MRDDMPCAQFRESLADPLDNVLSPALAEHLGLCDDCRDFRHDARVAARALREAGADYVPMDEEVLVGRLMAALDARETQPGLAPVVPLAEPVASAPSVAMATPVLGTPADVLGTPAVPPSPTLVAAVPASPTMVAAVPASPTQALSAVPASPTQTVAAVPASPTVVAAPVQGVAAPAQGVATVTPLRRPMPSWGIGAVAGALAAAAAALVVGLRAPQTGGAGGGAAVYSAQAWRATVVRVVRPREAGTVGLDAQQPGASQWESTQEGATLAVGTRLRTDARTRARVSLDDGTVLVLDRDAEVVFDPSAPRRARLVRGHLVADVAHREGLTARIDTPNGAIEVLGTKFALTATEARTLVRVTRGRVRLSGAEGSAEVGAGQEGVAARGLVPVVSPAVDLAGSVAWSELGPAKTAPATSPWWASASCARGARATPRSARRSFGSRRTP